MQSKQRHFPSAGVTHAFDYIQIVFIDQYRLYFFFLFCGSFVDATLLTPNKWERIFRYHHLHRRVVVLHDYHVVFFFSLGDLNAKHHWRLYLALVGAPFTTLRVLAFKHGTAMWATVFPEIPEFLPYFVLVVLCVFLGYLMRVSVPIGAKGGNRQGRKPQRF